jgi:hypothetical protein
MNIPKFTAESSFAGATAQYRSVGSVMHSGPEAAVTPQVIFLGYGGGVGLQYLLKFCPPMCADLGDGHCLCPVVGGI